MKNALYVYLLGVTRTALLGLATWSLIGGLQGWPLSAILAMAFGLVTSAAVVFAPYLLFSTVSYRLRQFLYFAPAVLLCGLKGYSLYQLASGQIAELSLSASSLPLRTWHGWIAECVIVLGVCISIYRRRQTFYDNDPVEELLKGGQ